MPRHLPTRPSLEHLKKQAKDLLRGIHERNPAAVERFGPLASRPATTPPKLADARRVIAREYGFASWAKLKQHVESQASTATPTDALVAAVKADDAKGVAKVLE